MESLRIDFIQMQEQQRLANRVAQQVSNIGGGIQSNVSRSVNRVQGHYQFEAVTTFNSDFDGDEGDYVAQRGALLKWSILPEDEHLVVQGISDINILNKFKNILLALRSEYGTDQHIFVKTDQQHSYNQRLLLLENQIEGLMKRKIEYSVKDQQGGHRVMDYTILLNEKQNQIIQLEKKINNLEERLRRTTARELELENHIQQLNADLRRKDDIIRAKNEQILAEVAASNVFRESLNRLRRNLDQNRPQIGQLERIIVEGVTFPDQSGFEIRADTLTRDGAVARTNNYSSAPLSSQYRTQMVSLFRQFDRLNNTQGITTTDFERVMEGFLVSLPGSRIGQMSVSALQLKKIRQDYGKLRQQFVVASQLYRTHIETIKRQNPGLRIDIDRNLNDLLSSERVTIDRIEGGVVFMERFLEKVIEVPVQDARTKHLLHIFASELKRLSGKYPKILNEMDVRLTEYFQQQLIDIIEVDEIDRIVEIVKYVPQVVKVENVYAYSSQKSRKVQFHLRVLIKALLEELAKLKAKTGYVPELDEGVIGMINQQIMGIVDVDDILKVFRVVPKIVEVEKIIQRIVDRIVEVPQVVPIQKIVEKIVEIQKIREVERIVNVPIEIPKVVNNVVEKIVPIQRIIEKVVEVPRVLERPVEVVRQVLKIVEVDRIVQKIVQVDKVIEIERHFNHMVPEIREIIVEVEKIVPVERIVEKIIEVPTFVERIVEKIVQVPQIVEVERIVEKIVDRVQYRVEKQMIPYVQVEHKIVEKIVERPIPIIQREERIVQVPQIVEKIVEVRTIQEEIRQVPVIRQKIVVQDRIKEIEKIVNVPVTLIREVEKIIEKRIQIPVIQERIIRVPEIITQPVVQRVVKTEIVEVRINDPIIIKQPQMIEVDKIINHYIDVPRPIKHIEQKIVEVPKIIERIKEVRVQIDKIIEKMVEVPKVVEVEKIVEKIVVVPRVIEKIVEIPQIVQVPVIKEIIKQVIREVEKIIQIPVIQERPVEIEIVKNIYIEVEKPVEIIRQIVVEKPLYEQKVITNQIFRDRVVEVVRQIPRQIEVERVVVNYVDREHIVEIERPIVVPVQIPVPVERIVERLIPVYETKQNIVQVPQILEKIVEVRNDIVEVKEVQSFVRDVVIDTKIIQVPYEKIVVQTQIKQVPTLVEKIVPVTHVVQEIVTAQQIVQKVIEKTNQIPKVYEVERIVEKVIEVPKIVEIQTIVPQLVRVNEFIERIVEKIVEVPIIYEKLIEMNRETEKIVQVQTEVPKIVEVQRLVERTVILEKFREAVKNINHIEQVLQIVDRFEQTPVAIHTKQQHLVEVPHIIEKIVEKIVVMPQIVEVLKYVHEIVETEELGVSVGVDIMTQEQKYKLLARNVETNFEILLTELNKLVRGHPTLRSQIELILRFLADLKQFIMFPKIIQVPHEKIVEKIVQVEKIVRVPTQDEKSIKMELSLSLLVEKLINEIKRIKTENPNVVLKLEDDVKFIFFTEFGAPSGIVNSQLTDQLRVFSDSVQRKFESLGPWTLDHQMMLNSFLQERFVMANIVKNSNIEIDKSRAISEKRLEGMRRYKNEKQIYDKFSRSILEIMPRILITIRGTRQGVELANQIDPLLRDFSQFLQGQVSVISQQPMRGLEDLQITDQRVLSLFREKQAEILKLREKLLLNASRIGGTGNEINESTIKQLTFENNNLKREISELRARGITSEYNLNSQAKNRALNEQILRLEQENADLRSNFINTRNELTAKLNVAEAEIDKLNILLGKSRNEPRTATQFNHFSPQSRNFSSPQSGVGVSIMNSQTNAYQGNTNSPMTARFSTSTGMNNPISPTGPTGGYGISSSTLSASRSNVPASSTVPVSGIQATGNYSSTSNLKAGIDGNRQSYSTNQMTNSESRSIGMTGGSMGLGMGLGAGGIATTTSQYSSGMQGLASYGGGVTQSGSYQITSTNVDEHGNVTSSRQEGSYIPGSNVTSSLGYGVSSSGSGIQTATFGNAVGAPSGTMGGFGAVTTYGSRAGFGGGSMASSSSSVSGSMNIRNTYGRFDQDNYSEGDE